MAIIRKSRFAGASALTRMRGKRKNPAERIAQLERMSKKPINFGRLTPAQKAELTFLKRRFQSPLTKAQRPKF